jgi:ABC-type spermidine/putrescine transport system permease subunit II
MSARRRRAAESWRSWLSACPGYLIIAIVYAPIVWLAVMSVSAEPLSGIPGPFTDEWYRRLFRSTRWVDPLWLSLGLGTAVGVVCMLVATLVGRSLPHLRWRGTVLVSVLVPLFVPGVVMGTALFMYFRSLMGFKLGLWSLVAGHFVWAFPFSLLAVVVMASRFDTRLVDAAGDLGATPWQRFWHIEFPALMPGVVAAGLFGFLLSFNELSRSIFLHGRVTTLSLYAWAQASSHTTKVPLIYALNTLVLLVSLALVCGAFWLLFARKGR